MYYGHGYGHGKVKKNGVAYDAVAAAYFAAVPNAFDSARKTIINTLIAGLRADGNLTKLDRLWLFANTTTGNAVIDVIGLNSVTLNNNPTFTADQGYAGDTGTKYINTNFKPLSNGVNLTQNNMSVSIYNRIQKQEGAGSLAWFGVLGSGTGDIAQLTRDTSNDSYYRAASVTYTNEPSLLSSQGLFTVRRAAAGTQRLNRNGAEISNAAVASGTLSNKDIYILGANNGSDVLTAASSNQTAIFAAGSADIDDAALYTRIQTYMTSLGTQV